MLFYYIFFKSIEPHLVPYVVCFFIIIFSTFYCVSIKVFYNILIGLISGVTVLVLAVNAEKPMYDIGPSLKTALF